MSNADEFPAICANCCGSDEHIKMIRQPHGEECKICTRPFTVFRWNIPNATNKSKKTIICMVCARARNGCQSCMLDITYLIPLEIRDAALKMAGIPNSLALTQETSTNREVKAIMGDKQEAKFQKNSGEESNEAKAKAILTKLAQRLNEPKNIDQNKNTNSKLKSSGPKSNKKSEINDKLKSVDVTKILSKLPFGGSLNTPADHSVVSFFIFGINDDTPQYAISDYCNQFGKTKNITIVHNAKCGFVSFTTRKAAELFAATVRDNGLNDSKNTDAKAGLLILENKYPVRVAWGKPKSLGTTNEEHKKIGLIVLKVLKQLTESNRKSTVAPVVGKQDNKINNKNANKKPQQALPKASNKVSYKATSENVEL